MSQPAARRRRFVSSAALASTAARASARCERSGGRPARASSTWCSAVSRLERRPASSALCKAAGRVLSREQLLDVLKGEEYESFDRSIDVHISKLRSKLEPSSKEPRYIKTVRGVGYFLSREESAE